MTTKEIFYTPEFLKQWRRTPASMRTKAMKKEVLFRQNLFHPSLKTHKLRGQLAGFFSFSIDYHWRIVFHMDGNRVYFDTIGTHEVYR